MAENAKRDNPEQKEFRAYCRDWLASNVPSAPSFKPLRNGAEDRNYNRAFQSTF